MKKKILIILIVIISLILLSFLGYKYYGYYKVKHAKIEVKLKKDLTVNFRETKKVSDYIESINGKIINDYEIDSTKIGKQKIEFKFINNDGIKVKYSFNINVLDITAPVVFLNNSYSIPVNSEATIFENILCGDDTDNNPECYVDGDFDLSTPGLYPVTFIAKDKSGNKTEVKFNLKIYVPNPNQTNNTTKTTTHTYFTDIVKNYKTDNTKIGIDVSGWQGEIDFEKIKNAGVEFIIIKVGGTKGTRKDYYVDSKFIRNIELANEYNIPVGVYFYSYSDSSKEAIKDAKWLLEQIKPYKVELGVAFDWEDFKDFNSYNLSFFGLTSMAEDFLNTVESAGYKGMIYGSKTYLERIWLDYKYDTWLAHYTDHTSYAGDYKYWQLCDDGVIDGINAPVDIDIMYEKE